jgi:hypothetical protein
LETDGTFGKSIEAYKRSKEAQLKQEKERINDEYEERRLEDDKKQALIRAQAYTLESVNKLIKNIRDQNEELKNILG